MQNTDFNKYIQEVQSGELPYVNEARIVGQVWPNYNSTYMTRGYEYSNNGQFASITVKIKMLKKWQSKGGGGQKQSIITMKAYDPVASTIKSMLDNASMNLQHGHGIVVGFEGETVHNRYKTTGDAENESVWKDDPYIQVKKTPGQTGYIPFTILGVLPVIDHGKQQAQSSVPQGNHGGQPQHNYQMPNQSQPAQFAQPYQTPQAPQAPQQPRQTTGAEGYFSPPQPPQRSGGFPSLDAALDNDSFPPQGFPLPY